MKLLYFIKRFGYQALPRFVHRKYYDLLRETETKCDPTELQNRLAYYFKKQQAFDIPDEAVAVKDFKKTRGTEYYLDLKDFLLYFNPKISFAYQFGDDTHVNSYPTLFKARPIEGDNENSILFKLNKKRHFKWVKDKVNFKDKKDLIVWRGGAYHKLRKDFVAQFYNHPLCNVGQTNTPIENVPWQKDYLSIQEQLHYKFIYCPEGNDVATNLKWVMSSNSICFMQKPKYETWFMEGTLIAGKHYVEIAENYSNLEEMINYYSTHLRAAQEIIKHANLHTERFKNKVFEDLLCLKVLERYTTLSHQSDALLFNNL